MFYLKDFLTADMSPRIAVFEQDDADISPTPDQAPSTTDKEEKYSAIIASTFQKEEKCNTVSTPTFQVELIGSSVPYLKLIRKEDQDDLEAELDKCLAAIASTAELVLSKNKTLPKIMENDKDKFTREIKKDEDQLHNFRPQSQEINKKANERIKLLENAIESFKKEIADLTNIWERINLQKGKITKNLAQRQQLIKSKKINAIDRYHIVVSSLVALKKVNNLMQKVDILKDKIYAEHQTAYQIFKDQPTYQEIHRETLLQETAHYAYQRDLLELKKIEEEVALLKKEKEPIETLQSKEKDVKSAKEVTFSESDIKKFELILVDYKQQICAFKTKWGKIDARLEEIRKSLEAFKSWFLLKENRFSDEEINHLQKNNEISSELETSSSILAHVVGLKEEIETDNTSIIASNHWELGKWFYERDSAKEISLSKEVEEAEKKKNERISLLQERIKTCHAYIETIAIKRQDIYSKVRETETNLQKRQSWKKENRSSPNSYSYFFPSFQ